MRISDWSSDVCSSDLLEVLKRRGPAEKSVSELGVSDLVMDLAAHQVRKGGVPVELTSREFRVLEYLMRNKGRVVTRSMILEAVWDYNFDPHTNVIDQYIRRIRKKIDPDNGEEYIHTIRGTGYGIWNE